MEAFGLKDQVVDILVPTQEKIVIDAAYVDERLKALSQSEDLARYVL